jgi:AcrR family transcriptional regulator
MPISRRRAYRRMEVDERRAQLLARATELFGEHGYGELSMARIAREAGISKALLYHYFPSKQALFAAALTQAATELRALTEPDASRSPAEQLAGALAAFVAWVDAHRQPYAKLMRSLGVAEVRQIVDAVRSATAARIVAGLGPEGDTPAARIAVDGWLWSIDGALLSWIEQRREVDADDLCALLLSGLTGALAGAGVQLAGAEARA